MIFPSLVFKLSYPGIQFDRERFEFLEIFFQVNLQLHSAVLHAPPESPSSCPVCKKTFLRLASLKSHVNVHLVDEHFVCQLCEAECETQVRHETFITTVIRMIIDALNGNRPNLMLNPIETFPGRTRLSREYASSTEGCWPKFSRKSRQSSAPAMLSLQKIIQQQRRVPSPSGSSSKIEEHLSLLSEAEVTEGKISSEAEMARVFNL